MYKYNIDAPFISRKVGEIYHEVEEGRQVCHRVNVTLTYEGTFSEDTVPPIDHVLRGVGGEFHCAFELFERVTSKEWVDARCLRVTVFYFKLLLD